MDRWQGIAWSGQYCNDPDLAWAADQKLLTNNGDGDFAALKWIDILPKTGRNHYLGWRNLSAGLKFAAGLSEQLLHTNQMRQCTPIFLFPAADWHIEVEAEIASIRNAPAYRYDRAIRRGEPCPLLQRR